MVIVCPPAPPLLSFAFLCFALLPLLLPQFHFGDVVFGVYQLALHHSTVNALDAVEGRKVTDADLIAFLVEVRVCVFVGGLRVWV